MGKLEIWRHGRARLIKQSRLSFRKRTDCSQTAEPPLTRPGKSSWICLVFTQLSNDSLTTVGLRKVELNKAALLWVCGVIVVLLCSSLFLPPFFHEVPVLSGLAAAYRAWPHGHVRAGRSAHGFWRRSRRPHSGIRTWSGWTVGEYWEVYLSGTASIYLLASWLLGYSVPNANFN